MPRLRGAAHSIPKFGHEDDEEIYQDTTLMAVRLMEAAEQAGKAFTPGTVTYYACKAARNGRRSYYTGASDVMTPGCQIEGRASQVSLDAEVETEDGEIGQLHDVVAPFDPSDHEADPGEEAARNLDWQAFLASHSPRHRIAIGVLIEGGTMREAGKRCGIRDSAALNLKRKIAEDLIVFFGLDTIRRLLGGSKPNWESDLRMTRERHACQPGNVFQSLTPAAG